MNHSSHRDLIESNLPCYLKVYYFYKVKPDTTKKYFYNIELSES